MSAELVVAGDGVFYVARQGYGLNVIDVTDPREPRISATFPQSRGTMDMLVDGQYLYLVPDLYAYPSWFGLIIFDWADYCGFHDSQVLGK